MPYFTRHESMYQRRLKPEVPLRNFHSAVKGSLLSGAPPKATLLDLGAGRGAECFRYRYFSQVVAVDKDPAALAELSRRCKGTARTVCADFLKPLVLHTLFDCVSAFFCCHYAVPDLDTLAGNVARHLAPGGTFVGVDLDGAAVLARLRDCRAAVFCGGWAKLELQPDDRHLHVTIASISNAPKPEGLLFWPDLLAALQKHGIELVETGMFAPTGLADDLAEYSRMHRWWVLKKLSSVCEASPAPPPES